MERYSYQAYGLTSAKTTGDVPGLPLPAPLPSPLGSAGPASTESATWVGKLGYIRDPELELYMLGAGMEDGGRAYDPATARFLTTDPIEFGGGDINLYCYGANDPVNNTDPDGRDWNAEAVFKLLKEQHPEVYRWYIESKANLAPIELTWRERRGSSWYYGRVRDGKPYLYLWNGFSTEEAVANIEAMTRSWWEESVTNHFNDWRREQLLKGDLTVNVSDLVREQWKPILATTATGARIGLSWYYTVSTGASVADLSIRAIEGELTYADALWAVPPAIRAAKATKNAIGKVRLVNKEGKVIRELTAAEVEAVSVGKSIASTLVRQAEHVPTGTAKAVGETASSSAARTVAKETPTGPAMGPTPIGAAETAAAAPKPVQKPFNVMGPHEDTLHTHYEYMVYQRNDHVDLLTKKGDYLGKFDTVDDVYRYVDEKNVQMGKAAPQEKPPASTTRAEREGNLHAASQSDIDSLIEGLQDLGGKPLSDNRLKLLREQMAERHIILEPVGPNDANAAQKLGPKDRAKFRVRVNKESGAQEGWPSLYFRPGATGYDIQHELYHSIHSRLIGIDKYAKLSQLEREQFVFDHMIKAKTWNQLMQPEKQHAVDYVYWVHGGNTRGYTPSAKNPFE